jgi:fructokinase
MVAVIGEALIDLVMNPQRDGTDGIPTYTAHPGGSPFNVAIGLARLGQRSQLLARLSADAFGRQLTARARDNGVDLDLAVQATEPSTLAVVGLDEANNAIYDFYVTGTADWQWKDSELAALDGAVPWVHTGSIASWTQPGAGVILRRLTELRRSGPTVISYDPNVRPRLMPSRSAAISQIEDLIALAHVVKASAEDLDWLYPSVPIADVLARWSAGGPRVTVVTDGGNGAHVQVPSGPLISVPAIPVDVVDTVGAGDAFMAGLIDALCRTGGDPDEWSVDQVRACVKFAIGVAALTCARAGANPPTMAEVDAAGLLDGSGALSVGRP